MDLKRHFSDGEDRFRLTNGVDVWLISLGKNEVLYGTTSKSGPLIML